MRASTKANQSRRRAACGPFLRGVATAAAVLTLFVVAGCSRGGPEKPAEPAQGAAARVNGIDIPETLVQEAIDLFLAQQGGAPAEPAEEEPSGLREEVVEALIRQELMLQKAAEEGISADPAQIESQMGMMVSQHGSPEAMREQLAKVGMTEDGLKRLMERNLVIETFLDRHVEEQVSVSQSDMETYYEEHPDEMQQPEMVRASHILVRYEEGSGTSADEEAARAKAEDLLKRARVGDDFAELAQQNSQDSSASKGGDLGFFPRGRMVPPFDQAAFSMGVGELSEVVKTRFGFHIIKVTDKRPAKALELAEVGPALRRHLETQERERLSQELMEKLTNEAVIERF